MVVVVVEVVEVVVVEVVDVDVVVLVVLLEFVEVAVVVSVVVVVVRPQLLKQVQRVYGGAGVVVWVVTMVVVLKGVAFEKFEMLRMKVTFSGGVMQRGANMV